MANSVDLWFSNEGDFQIDNKGDIKDTSSSSTRALVQEIRMRLRAIKGDWLLNKDIGANLEFFIGEPGTTTLLGKVARAITSSLTEDRLISPANLEIIPFRISDGLFLFRIIVATSEGEITEELGYDSDASRFIGY